LKKAELAKGLGAWDAFLLSVGGMIGGAIFVLGAQTGMITGPSALLAWALAGLLMFVIALVLVEQTTAFPRAGAIPAYAMETFGKSFFVRSFASFMGGWGSLLGQWLGVPFCAMYVGGYAVSLIPALAGYETVITLLVLTFAFLLNISGISITGKANAVLTLLLLILMFSFFARGAPAAKLENYTPFFATGGINFLKAIPIAALGYGAWLSILAAAEEVKEPEKTLPKAIGLSILVTTVFYLMMLYPLYGSVNWKEFTPDNPFAYWAPLSYAAVKFAPGEAWVQVAISLAAILALVTGYIWDGQNWNFPIGMQLCMAKDKNSRGLADRSLCRFNDSWCKSSLGERNNHHRHGHVCDRLPSRNTLSHRAQDKQEGREGTVPCSGWDSVLCLGFHSFGPSSDKRLNA
jgi:APA family basic amino acid/polyamine antiporter